MAYRVVDGLTVKLEQPLHNHVLNLHQPDPAQYRQICGSPGLLVFHKPGDFACRALSTRQELHDSPVPRFSDGVEVIGGDDGSNHL